MLLIGSRLPGLPQLNVIWEYSGCVSFVAKLFNRFAIYWLFLFINILLRVRVLKSMLAAVSERHNKFIWLLAGAGFIPFAFSFGAVLKGIEIFGHDPKYMFVAYSAIIVSFLSGTVWASSLQMKPEKFALSLMMLSNGLAVIAWACLLFSNLELALGVLMVLYPMIFNIEKSYRADIEDGYMIMRKTLTWVVFGVHGLMLTFA